MHRWCSWRMFHLNVLVQRTRPGYQWEAQCGNLGSGSVVTVGFQGCLRTLLVEVVHLIMADSLLNAMFNLKGSPVC
jgi:hypothetical protein